jgi:hypothetical protein
MPTNPSLSKSISASQGAEAYLLRIELRHFKPAIYREVVVDPAIKLNKLHLVIQAAMGWENAHMYGFVRPSGKTVGNYWHAHAMDRYEPPNPDGFALDFEKSNSDRLTRLCDLLQAPKDKLLYMYDFGDDWEHLITLQSVVQTHEPLPWLIKAQNACPPEDCGGLPGFVNMLQAFTDPDHPEHADVKDWLGEDFVPGQMDFEALQKQVRKLQAKPAVRQAAKRKVV